MHYVPYLLNAYKTFQTRNTKKHKCSDNKWTNCNFQWFYDTTLSLSVRGISVLVSILEDFPQANSGQEIYELIENTVEIRLNYSAA